MAKNTQRKSICTQCGEAIPQEARLCSHCQSYQDWRGWFSLSHTILALLVALVSVISISVPTVVKLFHTPKSDVRLATPSLDGTTLRIVAVNRGDAPAIFIKAQIHSDYLAGATRIKLRNDADAIIPPGSKLLIFDIIPLLNEDQSYLQSLEMIMNVIKEVDAPETSVVIGIEEFNGRGMVASFPLNNDDLFQLLRANAARCSAIKSPNFENGCVGTGAPPGEETPHTDSEQTKK